MGMLGPVVCYQVPRGIKSKDAKDLDDIKLIASAIDEKSSTIKNIYYNENYHGSRVVFRDASGSIKIFRETNLLDRKTFAGLYKSVGARDFALLVADVNVLVDCDPLVAAAFLTMNRKWGLQVFALKVDGLEVLSVEDITRARKVEDVLFANSEITQKFISNEVSKLCNKFPEIQSALVRSYEVESNDGWLRLLELSQKGEEPIKDSVGERKSRDPLFERKR